MFLTVTTDFTQSENVIHALGMVGTVSVGGTGKGPPRVLGGEAGTVPL